MHLTVTTPTPVVPKLWSLEPVWGCRGTPGPLTVLPCLSANLVSSFLLIAMLFVISLGLLIGVVKVRARSGQASGCQDLGAGHDPSYPPAPSSIHTHCGGGQRWLARGREVGILGDPSLHPRALHACLQFGKHRFHTRLLGLEALLPC